MLCSPQTVAARDPVELHRAQIGVGQLLQKIHALRTLDRNLREVVRQILDRAVELARIVAHPVEILFARAGVDHEQVFVFAEAVDDHVVHERSLRIEQRRILRLPDRQPRRVVHRDVLHRRERLRSGQADVAHVADVEDADAGAHRHVLVDDAAAERGGIFDRHVPAVELHHLRAHLAMDGVQRGFADGGRLNRRQSKPQ